MARPVDSLHRYWILLDIHKFSDNIKPQDYIWISGRNQQLDKQTADTHKVTFTKHIPEYRHSYYHKRVCVRLRHKSAKHP